MKFFILILSIFSINLEANIQSIVPSSTLPLELQLIFEDYRLDSESEEYERIQKKLAIIDQSFQKMSTSEILFFVKSQIYKEIINNRPQSFLQEMNEDNNLIREYQTHLQVNQDESNLKSWLKMAIQTDLKNLLENNNFVRALNSRDQGRPLNDIEQREFNKVKLILPWMRLFHYAENHQIQHYLTRMKYNIIEKLSLVLYQYHQLSSFDDFIPNFNQEMGLFELLDQEQIKKRDDNQRIQSIVERIIQNARPLPRPVDDWRPKEELSKAKDLFPEVDPNYVAPEVLPKPVNDWFMDL